MYDKSMVFTASFVVHPREGEEEETEEREKKISCYQCIILCACVCVRKVLTKRVLTAE